MSNPQKDIEQLKLELKSLADTVGAGNHDLATQSSRLQTQIEAVSEGIGVIQRATETNPDDPVARKALGQVPALTGSLGGVASGLRRVVLLRAQGASDQDVAAESLRITGSLLEIAATAAVIAPPPYGKIAAQIISAIQGLVNFVATILDLAHPAKKEPSVADIVDKAVRSVHGFAQRDLLTGVLAQLNHMQAGLQELHEQKADPDRRRHFKKWPGIWNLVELPAGEGVDVRVDSMPSWLMDEKNLDLEPDPWGEVFYLYLLAKGQYLHNWLSAMLLLDQPDAEIDAKKFLINGDYKLAAKQLEFILKTEQSILRQLTPFAVRKAMSVHIGSHTKLHCSMKGFVFDGTEWPFVGNLSGSGYRKIVAGPGRRLWALADGGLYFCLLDARGKELDHDRYPPGGSITLHVPEPNMPGLFMGRTGQITVSPKHHAVVIVPSAEGKSDIHVLASDWFAKDTDRTWVYRWDERKVDRRTDEGLQPADRRKPWDQTFYEMMETPPRYTPSAGYEALSATPREIAVSPSGTVYLDAGGGNNDLCYFGLLEQPGVSRKRVNMGREHMPQVFAEKRIAPHLAQSSERLYCFGGQYIFYRRYTDIARSANNDWTRISPPTKAPGGRPMPSGWSYRSISESEGGAVLASLELPGIGDRFYMWHDGDWEIGAAGVYGAMIITLPPDSHETFNALKGKVDELVAFSAAS